MMRNHLLSGSDWLFKGYIGEDWLWRGSIKPDTRDVRGWHPASVPGSVQHDLWKAGQIPDPYSGMNSLAIEWVPQRTWIYKKSFQVDSTLLETAGRRIELVFHGVDYAARYFLNGVHIGSSTGTYLPASFEVGDQLIAGENILAVVIDPAPFEQPQIGYTSKVYTQKARMNYWWDFCPRMVHLGIWQDVELRVTGPNRITDVWVRPTLSEDFQQAQIDVTVALDLHALASQIDVVLQREGQNLEQVNVSVPAEQRSIRARFTVNQPALWWPNGAGEQPLYQALVTVQAEGTLSDKRQVDFGIRRVEFQPNEAADPDLPGYTLTVNGRKIYIKGWNWVPADALYGTIRPSRYEHLLRLAQRANVNLLRVWGGGLIEREIFYALCDRLGILVWQEFIQSSSGIDNFPSSEPGFVAFLVQNAEAAIRLRRNHPSLAAWCGGNELHYDQQHLVDERHPAVTALAAAVRRLDPGRSWFPSSPSGGEFGYGIPADAQSARRMGDVHGPWEYQGLRKQYELYNQGDSLLHSEFGVEGLTNRTALDRTIPPNQQCPVSLNNPLWEHLGAWWVKEKVWQAAFGDMPEVDLVQRATQFLQADGLRYAVEADRRRKFHNSGTMPWQFNEPYPMAACTSAVDYFGQPKPVYYTVARAYAPVSITARFNTLAWEGEETYSAELWCAIDRAAVDGEVIARLLELNGPVVQETVLRAVLTENRAQALGTVSLPLSQLTGNLFLLDLLLVDNQGQAQASNRYLFTTGSNLAAMFELPQARVEAKVEQRDGQEWGLRLTNSGDVTALWIWLEADPETPGTAWFEDNYFCLMPGETRKVRITWQGVSTGQPALLVAGWNVPGQRVM